MACRANGPGAVGRRGIQTWKSTRRRVQALRGGALHSQARQVLDRAMWWQPQLTRARASLFCAALLTALIGLELLRALRWSLVLTQSVESPSQGSIVRTFTAPADELPQGWPRFRLGVPALTTLSQAAPTKRLGKASEESKDGHVRSSSNSAGPGKAERRTSADDDSRHLLRVASELDYDLTTGTTAHWHPKNQEIRAIAFVDAQFLAQRERNKHDLWPDKRVTCAFRNSSGVEHMGRPLLSFGAEENFGLDNGGKVLKRAITKGLVQGKYYSDLRLRTAYVHCQFAFKFTKDSGQLRLNIDKAMGNLTVSADLPVQQLPNFPPEESTPAVCSRVLAGTIDADAIIAFVEHNLQQGFSTTIFYETGMSFISQRFRLKPLVDAAKLIIVDLRDALQDMYRLDGPSMLMHVKAEGQWLARMDCLNRIRPLNPSWIVNLDMDEFPVPGLASSSSLRVVDWLQEKSNREAGIVEVEVLRPKVANCTALGDHSAFSTYLASNPPLTEARRLVKYMHRPFVNSNEHKIHRTKSVVGFEDDPTQMATVRHAARSEFYFFHLRCHSANLLKTRDLK